MISANLILRWGLPEFERNFEKFKEGIEERKLFLKPPDS